MLGPAVLQPTRAAPQATLLNSIWLSKGRPLGLPTMASFVDVACCQHRPHACSAPFDKHKRLQAKTLERVEDLLHNGPEERNHSELVEINTHSIVVEQHLGEVRVWPVAQIKTAASLKL